VSLAAVSYRDLASFCTDFGHRFLMGSEGLRNRGTYYARLDRFLFAQGVQLAGGGEAFQGWVDPLFSDPNASASQAMAHPVSNGYDAFHVGEWDRVAGTQRLYASRFNQGAVTQYELSPLSMTEIATAPWGAALEWGGNGLAGTTDGHFSLTVGAAGGGWVFFESLGYAICASATVRYAGTTYTFTPIQIDLSSHLATPIAGLITRHSLTPNAFNGPTLFGDAFTLQDIQFVPDEDSTPIAPKGFLFLRSRDTLVTGTTAREYMKYVDFNPTGKAASFGTANRVHLRETLVSRFEYEQTASPPTGIGGATTFRDYYYHQPSRTVQMLTGVSSPARTNVTRYATNPEATTITAPAERRDVLTGRIAEFSSVVHGNLGEPVAGADVDFVLERCSTVNEVLAVTGGIGSTSQIANFPVDDDLQAPLTIVRNGSTTLTLGVNYSVVLSTGVVTWITDEQANDITASYRHRGDPATPAHGALLNTAARTDENGEVIARVRYSDNGALVNELDRLTATV
jgi:hypothetical protein